MQNATICLAFNLPTLSHVIPFTQQVLQQLGLNQNPAIGSQGYKGIHSCTPLSHSPGSTHQPALLSSDHLPGGVPLRFIHSLTVDFLLLQLPAIFPQASAVYFTTSFWGFCKFYCCTPIKLLKMGVTVEIKCQSFCLLLFFTFPILAYEYFVGRAETTYQHYLLHELTQPLY